ncbi:MAG: hypothetical protein Q9191_002741 [Dirinaria sp. TL-2023a]
MLDFQAYLKDIYDEEVCSMFEERQASVNIMASLVRSTTLTDDDASFGESAKMSPTKSAPRGLSESDIYGNAFVYNFADHDTTAITLSWAIYLLAANPEVQEWIGEEIRAVWKPDEAAINEYREGFPKMKRCLAIMLEVLRLCNPLPGIMKSTNEKILDINIGVQTITIPAGVRVILHTCAIHTDPRYWGSSSLEWQSQRWIATASKSTSSWEGETLIDPPQGIYAPWSGGPRICLGKKFGQVEFVAVMATLFKDYRVEPIPRLSETLQSARARTLAAAKDNEIVLLLHMSKPESVSLEWVKESSK